MKPIISKLPRVLKHIGSLCVLTSLMTPPASGTETQHTLHRALHQKDAVGGPYPSQSLIGSHKPINTRELEGIFFFLILHCFLAQTHHGGSKLFHLCNTIKVSHNAQSPICQGNSRLLNDVTKLSCFSDCEQQQ